MGPFFHFRRPQKPNTSTSRSTRVGTLCGSTPRGFAAFFHSLPPPSNATGVLSSSQKVFRFFARDQGNFFSSHGPEARDLAARFYSTQTVVRSQGGLSSLSISRKLFASRVLPSLLASGAAVEIWDQAGGEGSEQEEWFLARAGRPGDTRALEDVMLAFSGQGASQAEQEASSLIGTGVTMAVLVQDGGAGRGAFGALTTLGGRREGSPIEGGFFSWEGGERGPPSKGVSSLGREERGVTHRVVSFLEQAWRWPTLLSEPWRWVNWRMLVTRRR